MYLIKNYFRILCTYTNYWYTILMQDGPNKGTAKGLKTVVAERYGEEAVNGKIYIQ